MQLTTLLALSAAQAMAQAPAHIPWDCYTETPRIYGEPEGTKVSDKDLISGLDIRNSRLTAISACTDQKTRLISGVTTTWGIWDSVNNRWTGVKAMNTVGYMSGLQEFNDTGAAASVGISLSQDADWALQQYWYQEASPEQEAFYLQRKKDNEAGGQVAWQQARQNAFTSADANGDGSLSQTEGDAFFAAVRAIDGKIGATDGKSEKIERHWNVASQLSLPADSMKFQDYLNLEKLMETFYVQGKLDKTGHAKGSSPGADLSHQCKTIQMADDNDDIVYIYITSSPAGVAQISLQTKTQPLQELGLPDTTRYSYMHNNWEQFEDDRKFMGLYGWKDGERMSALGFVQQDTACTNNFIGKAGGSYSWTFVIPGTEVTRPELPDEYKKFAKVEPGAAGEISETTNPTETTTPTPPVDGETATTTTEVVEAAVDSDRVYIPSHDHDNAAEGGLIAVCVIIWIAVAVLIVVFFYQYCKEKKGNASIAYEVQ